MSCAVLHSNSVLHSNCLKFEFPETTKSRSTSSKSFDKARKEFPIFLRRYVAYRYTTIESLCDLIKEEINLYEEDYMESDIMTLAQLRICKQYLIKWDQK